MYTKDQHACKHAVRNSIKFKVQFQIDWDNYSWEILGKWNLTKSSKLSTSGIIDGKVHVGSRTGSQEGSHEGSHNDGLMPERRRHSSSWRSRYLSS